MPSPSVLRHSALPKDFTAARRVLQAPRPTPPRASEGAVRRPASKQGGGEAGGKTLGVDLLSLKCIALSVYLLAVTQKQGDEIINDPINTYLMSTR